MSDQTKIPTDLLAALRDPNHAGHLNAAAASEIERLRCALDKITRYRPATATDMRRIAAEALGFRLRAQETATDV